ncbi:putative toxin-antitoxin system toxin component, PIN family [Roseofilum capinflatum]|uniref:Toxin-antitoxin system toxin component, PIN family n=1 Tax=Roseofilum capinflatum BLCC-M114 TaxID=3022440 RepID=A0ABT7B629_9CYAN|nr:putative toxin-antitoxin system toxin component, PIN family [Roseofilum capinflatum]MDJ1174277.1 putative toxin-antitoxin system toxin component, PIN family [Roseofilum capinflatum BLCC-M114]
MSYIAVFDTNILISSLLSTTSYPFQCLALAKTGKIESVTCQEILDEFKEKLLLKFKFSEEMAQAAVDEVLSFSSLVSISGTLKTIPADPDDDMVVECAVIGNASHIVTGDKHLLTLKQYNNICIVKAAEFIQFFSSS